MSYIEKLKTKQGNKQPKAHNVKPVQKVDPKDFEAQQALNELKEIQHMAGVSLSYDQEGRAWLKFKPSLNQSDDDLMDKREYAWMLFEMCYHLLDKSKG